MGLCRLPSGRHSPSFLIDNNPRNLYNASFGDYLIFCHKNQFISMMEKEDMFQTLKRLFLSHLFRLYILTHFVCLRQSLMTDNLTHACHPSCKYRATQLGLRKACYPTFQSANSPLRHLLLVLSRSGKQIDVAEPIVGAVERIGTV